MAVPIVGKEYLACRSRIMNLYDSSLVARSEDFLDAGMQQALSDIGLDGIPALRKWEIALTYATLIQSGLAEKGCRGLVFAAGQEK